MVPLLLKTRSWMIAVAVVAFMCAVESDRSRHRRHLLLRQQARFYARKAIDYENDGQLNRLELILTLDSARIRARQGASADELEALERKARTQQRIMEFCREMKRKYELAAADPSVWVAPDPPRPK